jgi:hypothetical protein
MTMSRRNKRPLGDRVATAAEAALAAQKYVSQQVESPALVDADRDIEGQKRC